MRMRSGNRGWKRGIGALLPLLVGLAGCEDPEGFARVERRTEVVATFTRVTVPGRGRVEYFGTAPQKDHPEFLVNWTNLNREITVELYIFRRQDYDPSQPPRQLAEALTEAQNQDPAGGLRVLWPQLPDEGPQFGDRLPTQLHLHPTTGDWVFVFYNPLDPNPINRATISGSIELSYFSLP